MRTFDLNIKGLFVSSSIFLASCAINQEKMLLQQHGEEPGLEEKEEEKRIVNNAFNNNLPLVNINNKSISELYKEEKTRNEDKDLNRIKKNKKKIVDTYGNNPLLDDYIDILGNNSKYNNLVNALLEKTSNVLSTKEVLFIKDIIHEINQQNLNISQSNLASNKLNSIKHEQKIKEMKNKSQRRETQLKTIMSDQRIFFTCFIILGLAIIFYYLK